MDKEQIIEGNALIAQFMGAYVAKEGQKAYDMDDKFPNKADRLMPEEMLYHESWDWLMPVLEHIKFSSTPAFTDKINQKRVEIFKFVSLFSSFDDIYDHVVQFISWFNQLNSKGINKTQRNKEQAKAAIKLLKDGIKQKNKVKILRSYDLISDDENFTWEKLDTLFEEYNNLIDEANDILM